MKDRVLITSVGRKVSLVKAFRDAGWAVHGKDDNKDAVALKFCDDVFMGSLDDYDLVVPTRDAELFSFSGFPGVASQDTLRTCVDKLEFSKWCRKNGFLTPEIYIVKPRISKSGKEVECVWQEKIEGVEHTIDLFADFGGTVISVVPRTRVAVAGGESIITTTVANALLLRESRSLATCLGLTGHNTMQCFVNGSEIIWTDVNCRFGGASIVGIKAGCDSPRWLLDLINGIPVAPRIGEYTVGLTGMSYHEWGFYSE